ncbi:unnamed protein product [Somion occarium]|uniref:Cytochrome P450 n=1 Tax=Somion occarium TaxID=3059160 RepID=A0ABP1DRZ8_9APHY
MVNTFALVAIAISVALIYLWFRPNPNNPKNLPLPPGPKGKPIIGSLLDIPSDRYWLTMDEWVREYGPIVTFKVLGKPVVILGSPKVAADLFDRRSAIYSDRPRWVLASEILARDMHTGTVRIGEKHRRYRKAIQAGLREKALNSYHPIEEKEARIFVKEVFTKPEDFRNSVKRFTSAVILGTMYGHKTASFSTDRFAQRIFHSASIFAGSLAPGKFLVDVMPWLQYVPSWVPGAGWKKLAAQWAEDDRVLYTEMLEEARQNAARQPSFISEGLGEKGYGVTEEELAYIGGTISQTPDTLMSVCSGFMLAMTRWPEVQKRAQAEIDSVVGRSRWPEFKDRVNLPYVTAIVKETCRWRPVAPLSVPHASTKDDVYEGYFIPKGTTVISSIWSIHRDPSVYPNPEEFIPERFLSMDPTTGTLHEINTEEGKERGHHLYGFGRRLCPGATMADHAVWIFAANVLWALNINRGKDENGNEIVPPVDPMQFTSGGEASHPLPWKCDFELREGVREFLEGVQLPEGTEL